MIELLIGLAVATVVIIGWYYGNLFVCVFLSLVAALMGVFGFLLMLTHPEQGAIPLLVSPFLLGIAWVPRLYWIRQITGEH